MKFKQLHYMADGLRDLGEFHQFELDLESRLENIATRFKSGEYELQPLKALPRPKKMDDGKVINRQYFHVPIDDQVAWIAIANVLGPLLDSQMPPWSYGNRIYRPAWYETDEQQQNKTLEIGPYRHASGHLYRKFQHSWPLFRRHVSLTCKTMSRANHTDDEDGHQHSSDDRSAIIAAKREGLRYLETSFWQPVAGKHRYNLHHASIDLKQFFPSISPQSIVDALRSQLDNEKGRDELISLVDKMLQFSIDPATIGANGTNAEVHPSFAEFTGIPTGLFVSGFLSNIAMLPIDLEMDEAIKKSRNVAHFRFVDDHTLIAYSFDDLCEWIRMYEKLLAKHKIGAEINWEKTDPEELSRFIKEEPSQKLEEGENPLKSAAHAQTAIEGRNPTKLLTKTLERISAIATVGIDTLDDDDIAGRLDQLEWLLLADIPDREIRADTRAAFAAGQISNLAPLLNHMSTGLVDISREKARLESKGENENLIAVRSDFDQKWRKFENEEEKQLARCFRLLMQAFREHPTKARLFFRIHQYCRLTGYAGLNVLCGWLRELADAENFSWHDYYTVLSFQLIGDGVLRAVRVLQSNETMRTERRAALRYIKGVSDSGVVFKVPPERQNWAYKVAYHECRISLMAASTELRGDGDKYESLSKALANKAGESDRLSFSAPSSVWQLETGYSSGIWAYSIETRLSSSLPPTLTWGKLEKIFNYELRHDQLAARYFPKHLSDRAFAQLNTGLFPLKSSDAGWILDCMREQKNSSTPLSIVGGNSPQPVVDAVAILNENAVDGMNLYDWVKFTSGNECDPFDPRRGEWTCLEIIRQLVQQIEEPSFSDMVTISPILCLHPANISLPTDWKPQGTAEGKLETWAQWRKTCRAPSDKTQIEFNSSGSLLDDYRYKVGSSPSENLFRSIGRILVGLLVGHFDAPSSWNIRGNENIVGFPASSDLEMMAISSRTLLIIDACLNKRSEENRLQVREQNLFSSIDFTVDDDTEFDAPIFETHDDLLNAIIKSQEILEQFQISITEEKPRQLIPFRLEDFAKAAPDESGDHADDQ
jgi:hypothetical protein